MSYSYCYIDVILNPKNDPPEYIIEVRDSDYKILHTKTSQITHPGGKLIMKVEKALVEAAIPEVEELWEKHSKYRQGRIKVNCTSDAFSKKAEKEITCKYIVSYVYNPYALKDKMRESEPDLEHVVEEKKYTEIILLSL